MSTYLEKLSHDLSLRVSNHIGRYGLGATALILSIESVWAASVLVPVLFVIGFLFQFTNAWMSVLPGFLGALTFLIVLTIGGLAAVVPSTYVAKWREGMLARIARQHPAMRESAVAAVPELPSGLEIQDAD